MEPTPESDPTTADDTPPPPPPKWGIVGTLRAGVRDLFPTRKTKAAMWGLVGLGVLITYLELMAADLFGNLITNIDEQSTTETILVMLGFLLAFVGVRGISYFQSVYRLTVFEKALRGLSSGSAAAATWRWPMAIALVGILGQVARLVTVTVKVATTAWLYGVLLSLCTLAAILIVNRTGRRQYVIHHEFVSRKRAGQPPTAAERIGTRIRAGERAGLVAIGPVLVYIVALGVGAARGNVSAHAAIVLFIAGRMAGNMYGGLANATMRLIRAQVNVEAYGGAQQHTRQSPGVQHPDDVVAEVVNRGYLWEPPGQAIARMIDDGHFVGDVETVGRVARESGAGPQQGLRRHAPASLPERLGAVAPNQVWFHDAVELPVSDQGAALHVVEDVFSRAIVAWKVSDDVDAETILSTFDEGCRAQAVQQSDITFQSAATIVGPRPGLHDLLKALGVSRTLLWAGPEGSDRRAADGRPPFPTRFPSRGDAEAWIRDFVRWYNDDFYQPQVGYLHPAIVHAGLADVVTAERQGTLEDAGQQASAQVRFPDEWLPPEEAWISRMTIGGTSRQLEDAEAHALDEDEDL